MQDPTEAKIMAEIYRNGPVSVSWNPPAAFPSYKGGVLAQISVPDDPMAAEFLQLESSYDD